MNYNAFCDYLKNTETFTNEIRTIINKKNESNFARIYEEYANNVKIFGDPFNIKNAKNIDFECLYKFAKRINRIVKLHKNEGCGRIVIDAFRNPLETIFFRERYAAFYLFAIKCDDDDLMSRPNHIEHIDIQSKEISIDNERPEDSLKNVESFVGKNVPGCVQIADIHIMNKGKYSTTKIDTNELTIQLCRYIALIERPGIMIPTDKECFMQIAYTAKLKSGCISRQVGAVVISNSGKICGIGWNEVPEGQVSCLMRATDNLANIKGNDAFSKYEQHDILFNKKLKELYPCNDNGTDGRLQCYCFKDVYIKLKGKYNQVHTRALHAEENAFLQIAKHGGIGIEDGILYCTASPCELCAKKANQLNLKKIVYIDDYPGISEKHVLSSSKYRTELEPYCGAIGRAYNKIYEPFIPYKDELKAMIEKIPNEDDSSKNGQLGLIQRVFSILVSTIVFFALRHTCRKSDKNNTQR